MENFNIILESLPVLPLAQRYYRHLTRNGTTAAPTVLPLPACRIRVVDPCIPFPPTPLGLDYKYPLGCLGLDRLGFEIRVELDSFFSKVSFLPLVGMVPPLVEKIPVWIQDLYL